MKEPHWYQTWRHDAVHELQDKNARLKAEFKLGSYERWDYELEKASLVFSHGGKPVVSTRIQVVGSTVTNKNWLWAWGNNWWPELTTKDAGAAKLFGEKNGIAELTTPYLEDESLEHLGWELSAVTARITSAIGAYRPPSGKGFLFLLFRDVNFVM